MLKSIFSSKIEFSGFSFIYYYFYLPLKLEILGIEFKCPDDPKLDLVKEKFGVVFFFVLISESVFTLEDFSKFVNLIFLYLNVT